MTDIRHNLPSPEAFMALRAETRWGVPNMAKLRAALDSSLCGAVAVDCGETVAMVRAVGDGILNVYIQDVIVKTDARGQGIGSALMRAILAELGRTCPHDCEVGLFAAEGQSAFYTRLGFTARPAAGFGPALQATLGHLQRPALAIAETEV